MTTTTVEGTEAPDHGHHDHPAHLAHHFDTSAQQEASAKMGMWLFLSTEVLMFSGLFMAYAVARWAYPDMMLEAHHHLSIPMGAINTVVLITSSFTMALGVRAAQTDNTPLLRKMLLATIFLAGCFMVVKYFEYSSKFEHGLLPGRYYTADYIASAIQIPSPLGGAHTFFGIYFLMTGLHGVHVVLGMGVLTWIYLRAGRGEFSHDFYTPVENVGLYWHLVDLVWIFLFPLLYLVK